MSTCGTPAIIDVDPGVDDAAALFIALTCSRLDTSLVTTVGGSIGVNQATANALKLEAFLGTRALVARGRDLPNSEKRHYMQPTLGPSGLGSWVFADEARDLFYNVPAKDAICQTAKSAAAKGQRACMICLAPLTNLADALEAHPDLPDILGPVFCMGSTMGTGDTLQRAGRNVAADPASAKAVLASGLDVFLVPVEVAAAVRMSDLDMADIALSGRVGNAVYTMLSGAQSLDGKGKEIADPIAVGLATHPEFFTVVPGELEVEDDGSCGVKIGEEAAHPNCRVATAIDVDAFRAWFKWALERASR